MTGPPAAGPGAQEARGAGPQSRSIPNPNYVRVLNPVTNGTGIFKRKKAEHYVKKGRAEWVDDNQLQLRLIMSHPKNIDAAGRACSLARGYDSVTCAFQWFVGTSNGAVVTKTERGVSHMSGANATTVGRQYLRARRDLLGQSFGPENLR